MSHLPHAFLLSVAQTSRATIWLDQGGCSAWPALFSLGCGRHEGVHVLPMIEVGNPENGTSSESAPRTGLNTAQPDSLSSASTQTPTLGASPAVTSTSCAGATSSIMTGSSAFSSVQSSTSSGSTSSQIGESSEEKTDDSAKPDDKTCLKLCEKGTKDAFADCDVEFKSIPITAHYTEEYETKNPETGEAVTKARGYFGWNHHRMSDIALGLLKGMFDTVSLGCEGVLAVGFMDPPLTDGPGPDLIIFENPFAPIFLDPARIEVSDDACTWQAFPCNPITLQGCAGVSVVNALPGKRLDLSDPAVAGGDAFDLADLKVARARFCSRDECKSRILVGERKYRAVVCARPDDHRKRWKTDIDAFAFVHASATVSGGQPQ